ncbi:MAG: iron ABC transporter ATP-binding protein [Caldibacillus debilis]|jgi:iron complex transport system ATP-binding protein|uniref:ABC-type cobalamin/Fe3+-siderophore transport system, ATPase component n=1 Tax=Caldibacillus debilis GB1 TaxID=1339248 RepID=A0A420VBY0_9BACI|nr:ABC transporter ATP-binding protein [Caldibacillus debilis]REJ20364.1 MAG: iron ABC transporter ATP-binding protein [Caldibacillus debilis]RKO61046.1 ABC-type cobalamin/Fe3+-siderophore transport system, ATPase component [Caldibacillus debilis GB1]
MLTVKDLTYRHSKRFGIDKLNLEFPKGEVISIIGPNGSGKSTLLRLIAALLRPEKGAIILDGKNIVSSNRKAIARQLTMLPQTHDSALDFTVRELVEFGRNPHKRKFAPFSREDKAIIDWALALANVKKYEHRPLFSLSGGERQRAWIAMVLAQRTDYLLLDEPTTFLDIVHQLEILEVIHAINQQDNRTVIMVLHDLNQAAQYSDRLIVMKDGAVYQQGSPEEVFSERMFAEVFGIAVSIHEMDGKPMFVPKRLKRRGKEECTSLPIPSA